MSYRTCPECESNVGHDATCGYWRDLQDRRAEEDAGDALRFGRVSWEERVRYEREDQANHEPYEREAA